MKRTIGIVAFLAASLLARSVLAQDDAPERRRRPRGGEGRERREGAEGRRKGGGKGQHDRGARGKAAMDKLLAELKLPADKRASVAEILKTHHQAVANWVKENASKRGELRKQMAEARKAGDKDKARELGKEMRELGQARKELQENLFKQLGEVLTKEQLAKVKEMMRPRRRAPRLTLAAIGKLDLTEAQQAAMKKIMAEAKAKAEKAENPRAKRRIRAAALRQVAKEVLTDAQRKKLHEMAAPPRRGADMLKGLDLTAEQQAQIKAIEETFREAMKTSETPEAKRDAFKARREGVHGVLTEEQLKKLRERGGRGRGGRGEGRGPRGGDAPPANPE